MAIRRRGALAVAATLIEPSGETFNAFLRVGVARRLSNESSARRAIGCEATVRHWGRTARGTARHAVLHQLHDDWRAA